ncbi:MAG: hypothetical protein AB8B51_07215 [Sedimentitalea sp.]
MVPQANTTVEPEFWAMMPPGWSVLSARLVSGKTDVHARLLDYGTQFAATADQFADAPIDVLAAACSGASYLMGAAQERDVVAEVERQKRVPFITSALASVAALRQLGARDIALLSPYPQSLTKASRGYWQAHGFRLVGEAAPQPVKDEGHPIYTMTPASVLAAYHALSDKRPDAVLMLGTGMATLEALRAGQKLGLAPAVSCNLALAWAASQSSRWDALSEAGLAEWITGASWQARFECLFPEPLV